MMNFLNRLFFGVKKASTPDFVIEPQTLENTLEKLDELSINFVDTLNLSNDEFYISISKHYEKAYYFSSNFRKSDSMNDKEAILSKKKIQENINSFFDGKLISEEWFEDIYTNHFEAIVRRKRGRKSYYGRTYILRYFLGDGSEDEIHIYEQNDSDTNFYSGDKILIEENGATAKITNLVTGKSVCGALKG